MALSGPDKELRGQSSLGCHTLIRGSSEMETLDHHPAKASSDPGRLNVAGTLAISPISVGSKVKATRYRECLKNHAASMGGNVTDGCGEFMPSGEEGTIEALKCAACSCHRNFHRKEEEGGGGGGDSTMVHPLQLPSPLPSPSVNQHHRTLPLGHVHSHANHYASMVPPVKMAFVGGGGGSAGTESSSEELNFNAYHSNSGQAPQPPPPPHPLVLSKKRFRTKFTQEQKDRMLEFAEKVGWRIPREDDPEVQRFCAEVGVKRQVLKVWMHNNKNSSARKLQPEGEDQRIIEDCTS